MIRGRSPVVYQLEGSFFACFCRVWATSVELPSGCTPGQNGLFSGSRVSQGIDYMPEIPLQYKVKLLTNPEEAPGRARTREARLFAPVL